MCKIFVYLCVNICLFKPDFVLVLLRFVLVKGGSRGGKIYDKQIVYIDTFWMLLCASNLHI